MIYIKNNTETQTIFIPRNELQKEAYITSTKTYEDGYREGLEDGKEQQKDQLLNLYVTENGQYEREDGWGVVTVDIPIDDCPDCSASYEEGYEIGKNEGYEDGFQDGYDQGQSDCPECDECPELTSINITKNGSYEGAFKLVNVDVPNEGGSCNLTETSINLNKESATIIASNEGFDGYSKVTVTAWAYGDVRYAEGYEQGKSDCPKLTSINITENGKYEGAYNVVNVNVPSIDNYNYHILTAIGGVMDYGNVPFNVTTFRQKAYNITTFWGDRANAVIENGNLLPNVLVHSLIFGVTHIGAYSFQNMKRLTDITVCPYSIGDYAFANCKNLNRITIYGLSTSAVDYNISETAFEGVADKGVVILYDNNEEGETWVRDVFMTKLPSEWAFEIINPK